MRIDQQTTKDIDVINVPWRIGTTYGIHVYTAANDKPSDTDVPVATFMKPEAAQRAVADHNAALEARRSQ